MQEAGRKLKVAKLAKHLAGMKPPESSPADFRALLIHMVTVVSQINIVIFLTTLQKLCIAGGGVLSLWN
jgi:hypothetical protein